VSELSEAEREALAAWWASEWPRDERDVLDTLAAAVEQVVAAHTAALAAKVAAVEALADRSMGKDALDEPTISVLDLRRALAAVPDTAPSGVLDGPSFGDYWPAESVPDTAADAGGDAGVGL
jgi:hypothetical protein